MIRQDKQVTYHNACRDCTERTPTCHGSCKKYQVFREELDALNKRIREEQRMDRLTRPSKRKAR